MSHKLTKLSKSILQEPQLMYLPRFEEIVDYMNTRNIGEFDISNNISKEDIQQLKMDSESTLEISADTPVGVLRIEGTLTYKPTGFEALCGGASYQSLIEQTQDLCNLDSIDTIVMIADSGGGMAYRMAETARTIRKMCDDSGKKLVAYVDGMAASACFGLTCVAHEVIVNPESLVGSIGVVVRLVNANKAEKEAGYETTYITAGDSKVPFDSEGGFREEYLSDIQERVSECYESFTGHVSTYRSISLEAVKGTEAKVFSAEKALELGLVDKIMEGAEFSEYLSGLSENTTAPVKGSTSNKENLMTDTTKVEASVDADLLAQMKDQLEQQASLLAGYKQKEVQAEKDKLDAELSQVSFLSECKEDVLAFMMDSNVSGESKTLLSTVIAQAEKANASVLEEAADKALAAEQEVNEANAEKEKIKAEFGEKQNSVDAELKEEVSGGNQTTLEAKIAAKKAALLNKSS